MTRKIYINKKLVVEILEYKDCTKPCWRIQYPSGDFTHLPHEKDISQLTDPNNHYDFIYFELPDGW